LGDVEERPNLGKLEDLIAQVDDVALRQSLVTAASEAKESRNFGLVFEQHIPETVAVLGLPVLDRAWSHRPPRVVETCGC
jgi:hypothetical protein